MTNALDRYRKEKHGHTELRLACQTEWSTVPCIP